MSALVLLADDVQEIVESHAEILRQAGYRVLTARNGEEAVALAIAQRPDVILMDIDMPVLDGWEATRRIRADLRTHRIPVIAFTSYGLRRYIDRSFDAGCTAFLDKPCDGRVMLAEVARALHGGAPLGVVVSPAAGACSGASLRALPDDRARRH